ncbi:MAG TPA: ferritin-like domain-containing protein [Thermoanaerobacterales bacterium]|jgi:rubrerythrin|nr:ferritin-like domain-containing protein [Thermoanaerobacterales bacterium]
MDYFCRIVEQLRRALLDERTTAAFYAILRDMSTTFDGVDAFAEARKDEQDHAREITALLERLTGQRPPEADIPVQPPMVRDYCQGIMEAIRGEREAAVEYQSIINISPYEDVNIALSEIRGDEEVHLAKFQALYRTVCEKGFFAANTGDNQTD